MKEDFLHYIWKYKKFEGIQLFSVQGKEISIVKTGQYLEQAGPDFFNAQLLIDGQKWAGNIEIHLKSSDWYVHKHETDKAYNSVILHVVWEHDTDVYNSDNQSIETLELKNIVSKTIQQKYSKLLNTPKWINCESDLKNIDSFIVENWLERLYIERLEEKSVVIDQIFNQTQHNWEATLFCVLAKTFGLNINGEYFLKTALQIPFLVIQKERFYLENLEALLLGAAGLLSETKEDVYYKNLQKRWEYLRYKYKINIQNLEKPQLFKLRPDNFPTIRLAQLAKLLHMYDQLFFKLILAENTWAIFDLFKNIQPSEYWQTHYTFDHEHEPKSKKISQSFINLLMINALIPMLFYYHSSQKNLDIEKIIVLLTELPPEKNVVIDRFATCGIETTNAFQTQALLQLKRTYCEAQKCLNCSIGQQILYG